MAERAEHLGLTLRPHVKTHKCPEITRRQLESGARGITVATIHEAEVFIAAGAVDVLVAYPPVGEWRLDALTALIEKARVIVACDAPAHVRTLGSLGERIGWTFEYYWEIDCGGRRLGTKPGEQTAAVLEQLAEVSGARLAGIMTFPAQSYGAKSVEARNDIARAEGQALLETRQALSERRLNAGVLSGGSTPTAFLDAGKELIDEYRCGNYVFFDATQVALGNAKLEDCALTVESTVVGRPSRERVILDAGSKALAAERMSQVTPGFGIVVGHPELTVSALYEEHAICSAPDGFDVSLEIGDIVQVVPNHACTCANLHAAYVVSSASGLQQEWPIPARNW